MVSYAGRRVRQYILSRGQLHARDERIGLKLVRSQVYFLSARQAVPVVRAVNNKSSEEFATEQILNNAIAFLRFFGILRRGLFVKAELYRLILLWRGRSA